MMGAPVLAIVPFLSTLTSSEYLKMPLAGRTALAWTLGQLVEELPDADIVLTTDDDTVARSMQPDFPSVKFFRRTELAYEMSLIEVLEAHNDDAQIVAVFEPTHPFRPRGLASRTVSNLFQRPELESIVCVRQFGGNLWQIGGRGEIEVIASLEEKGTFFQELRGLGLATRPHVLRAGRRIGDNVGFEVVDDLWSSIDVRDSEGFERVYALSERLVAAIQEDSRGT